METSTRLIRLRCALYGGISGSLGATAGWLVWVAVIALQENWKEVAGAVVAGACVGFVAHSIKEYIETAREEAAGPPSRAERQRRKHENRHHTRQRARAAVISTAAVFLILACEHLVSHVISLVMLPFVASVVGFFLPGAMFAYCCWHLPYEGPPDIEALKSTMWAGIVSGIGVGLIFSLMNKVASGYPALAWWWSFSMGMAFVYVLVSPLIQKFLKYRRNSTFHDLAPAFAVPILICLTLSFSDPNYQRKIRESRNSPDWTAPAANVMVDIVDQMLVSGDLPETFWRKADEGLRHGAASGGTEGAESKLGLRIARRIGCDAVEVEDHKLGATSPGSQGSSEEEYSQAILCGQLKQGLASGLVRSWCVLATFAFGLGLGYRWERKFRPAEYRPESETLRSDFSALNRISLAILLFIAYVRWHGF